MWARWGGWGGGYLGLPPSGVGLKIHSHHKQTHRGFFFKKSTHMETSALFASSRVDPGTSAVLFTKKQTKQKNKNKNKQNACHSTAACTLHKKINIACGTDEVLSPVSHFS